LARRVHGLRAQVYSVLAVATLSGGCVIPPSLEVGGQDAAPNSLPGIVAARTDIEELPAFGDVNLDVNADGFLNLELMDTDLNDTLYAFMFVDYNRPNPTPPRSTCSPSVPSGSVVRTASCALDGVCLPADATSTKALTLSIVVFDRELLPSGQPRYMNVTEPGESGSRTYVLTCTQGSAR